MNDKPSLIKIKQDLSKIFYVDPINRKRYNYLDVWFNLSLIFNNIRSAFLINWSEFNSIVILKSVIKLIKNVNKNFTDINNIVKIVKLDCGILVTTNNYWHCQGIRELIEEYKKTNNGTFLALAIQLFPINTEYSKDNIIKFTVRVEDRHPSNSLDNNLYCSTKNKKYIARFITNLGKKLNTKLLVTFQDVENTAPHSYNYYEQLPEFLDDNSEVIFDLGVIYSELFQN